MNLRTPSNAGSRVRSFYQQRLAEVFRLLIPPGMRVLELGCGQGDLLAALRPSRGVGIDFSPAMIERAQGRHPQLEFLDGRRSRFRPRVPIRLYRLFRPHERRLGCSGGA